MDLHNAITAVLNFPQEYAVFRQPWRQTAQLHGLSGILSHSRVIKVRLTTRSSRTMTQCPLSLMAAETLPISIRPLLFGSDVYDRYSLTVQILNLALNDCIIHRACGC